MKNEELPPSQASRLGGGDDTSTFWDHLDVLRAALLRAAVVTAVLAVAAFVMKDWLFAVVLAPRSSDFITYQLLETEPFFLHLMNTGLTEQFMVHVHTALYAGLLLASPYIIYEAFGFISPALYRRERYYAVWIIVAAYAMFITGTLTNYFVVFPLTLRFLGTYQVSADVENMLTLQSYVDTLLSMSLVMGAVFELPVISAILGRMGIISSSLMSSYRRHALVAILIVAAIITPTTDVFTLFIVALPIYLLYEVSILINKFTN